MFDESWQQHTRTNLLCGFSFLPFPHVHLNLSLIKMPPPLHLRLTVSLTACVFVSQGSRLEAGCSRLDGTYASDGPGQSGLREIGRQNLWWAGSRQDSAVVYWRCHCCKSFHCVVSSLPSPSPLLIYPKVTQQPTSKQALYFETNRLIISSAPSAFHVLMCLLSCLILVHSWYDKDTKINLKYCPSYSGKHFISGPFLNLKVS